MSSISKACMELSKSIKGFRFSRSPTETKDFSSGGGGGGGGGGGSESTSAAAPRSSSASSSASSTLADKPEVTYLSSVTADSVTNTISRVIRSATNRVRSFPAAERNGHGATTAVTSGGQSAATAVVKASTNDLWMDGKFLAIFFRCFTASELCVLAQVCRRWRDVLYEPTEGVFWTGVTPIINCKELPGSEETRRSFYRSIELRGFDSVCLVGAVDQDVTSLADDFGYCRTGIVHLSIRCSNLTDKGLEALLDLTAAVTGLELSGCNEVTEAGLWACLPARLLSLSISDCINVADDSVGAVAQLLPTLRELNLQAYHVTDSALSLFSAKQGCSLRVLRLQSCWEITNHGVVNVIRSLPSLTVLSLSGCSKITDDGVEVVAENLRHLESLDLSWCSRITDAALEYIACDLACLRELTLDRCCHVTDIGIGYLSTMTSLNRLFLRWCTQVRDFGLQHMYTMKNLKVLSLAGCNLVTPGGLTGLVQLVNLRELELTNCPSVANTDVCQYLKERMPRCVIIE